MLTSPCCDCETNPTTCNMPTIASQTSIGVHPKGNLSGLKKNSNLKWKPRQQKEFLASLLAPQRKRRKAT